MTVNLVVLIGTFNIPKPCECQNRELNGNKFVRFYCQVHGRDSEYNKIRVVVNERVRVVFNEGSNASVSEGEDTQFTYHSLQRCKVYVYSSSKNASVKVYCNGRLIENSLLCV